MIFSGISEKTHEFLVFPPLVGSFNDVCSWFPTVSFLLFVCTSAVDPAADVLSAVAPIPLLAFLYYGIPAVDGYSTFTNSPGVARVPLLL